MSPSDLAGVVDLSLAEHAHVGEAEWLRLMALSPEGCRVAAIDGRVVGAVATVLHDRAQGRIACLLTSSDRRGGPTAERLLASAVDVLRTAGAETVKADVQDSARMLFRKAGFAEEHACVRCVAKLDQLHETELVRRVQPLSEADFDAVAAFDETASGADRSEWLRGVWDDHPNCTFVYRTGGTLQGFVMLRPAPGAWLLGPWCAVADEVALNLLYQALSFVGTDQTICVDVGTRCSGAAVLLEPFGFRSLRSGARMVLGPNLRPGRPERVYGLWGLQSI